MLTDWQTTITPYFFNHTHVGVRMREQGFEAREVATSHPMWLRSVSAVSDSAAHSRIRPRWWQRPARIAFADFGATEQSIEKLRHALAEAPAAPSPLPPGRSRLAQKMELAQTIRALKAASVRSDEDDAEIERLTTALYDL